MTLNDILAEKTKKADEIIYSYLPENEGITAVIREAMAYSVQAGGKRLRPVMLAESYKACGGEGDIYKPFMAALEFIHTYSLVHDDLPAMDNDTLRRGKATTWVEYGEAMAVLCGDALLNYAFETAAAAFDMAGDDIEAYKRIARALKCLSRRAGIYGMVGGQVADVEAEKKALSLDEKRLIFIHENKTGALIQAAFEIGAILAGADEEKIEALSRAALCTGVAFQIQDDILDVEGDEKLLGKNIGSDAQQGKETYVTLFGLEQSRKEQERLSDEAIRLLDENLAPAGFLSQLVESLTKREY